MHLLLKCATIVGLNEKKKLCHKCKLFRHVFGNDNAIWFYLRQHFQKISFTQEIRQNIGYTLILKCFGHERSAILLQLSLDVFPEAYAWSTTHVRARPLILQTTFVEIFQLLTQALTHPYYWVLQDSRYNNGSSWGWVKGGFWRAGNHCRRSLKSFQRVDLQQSRYNCRFLNANYWQHSVFGNGWWVSYF